MTGEELISEIGRLLQLSNKYLTYEAHLDSTLKSTSFIKQPYYSENLGTQSVQYLNQESHIQILTISINSKKN